MNTLLFTIYNLEKQGGIENYYRNLIEYYPDKEHLTVLQNDKGQLIKNWLRPKWLPAIVLLYKTVKQKKIDHILAGEILPIGTVVYLTAKLTKTPYTVFIHGMDFTYVLRKTRKKRIAKRILTKAKNVICANSYVAGMVKEFLGDGHKDKVRVVNPGIDPLITHNSQLTTHNFKNPIYSDKEKVTSYELRVTKLKKEYYLQNKIVLFSVGRLVKRKGFDKVIEALPEVVRSVPNLYYILAGDGPDKKYIYEKAKGVPNIIFLGSVSEEDKWAWLNLCDIFIMPARFIEAGLDFEGFGIVYLEANLCGKPVIAGDSGGVRDAVKGAYSGLLVDPKNIDRIAGAIITLAHDPELRRKLGEQGKRRAIEEFRWDKQAGKVYHIINGQKNNFQ